MMSIKQLRENRKLSQTDFAKKMDVSLRTVQNWEANQEKIPMDKLGKIYRELEGDMPKIEYNQNEYLNSISEPKEDFRLKKLNESSKNIKGVPYYDIEFTAGFYFYWSVSLVQIQK